MVHFSCRCHKILHLTVCWCSWQVCCIHEPAVIQPCTDPAQRWNSDNMRVRSLRGLVIYSTNGIFPSSSFPSPHPPPVVCWFSPWSSVWLYLHTVWSPAPCQLVQQCAGTLCNKLTPPQQTSNLYSADFLNTPCRRLWHTWRFKLSLPVLSSMFLLMRTPQKGWDDAGTWVTSGARSKIKGGNSSGGELKITHRDQGTSTKKNNKILRKMKGEDRKIHFWKKNSLSGTVSQACTTFKERLHYLLR